ncbi:hypothetical protein ASE61_00730 [Bosea sp. Root670]|uniref:hypothetical protein n=1 Tax=Bosea sp. Root670 TaxID=1736583 RepID=UPI0007147836|nr:hypothetical protein [Bosea sp. Root670]KRE08176.1 hypothetical protein ASE61_00730 [Bosea sp. Root670]
MAKRAQNKPVTILRVVRGGYEPVAAIDAEFHAGLPLGAEVTATIDRAKSNDSLRLYWGFLGWVVENRDEFGNSRALSNALLVETGHAESFNLMDGSLHVFPQSIAEMDAAEFQAFCTKAFDRIYGEFDLDVETYKAEMADKAGGRR